MTAPLLPQGPAAFRYRVGDIVVTMLHDGHNRLPLREGFVRGVSLAEMEAALAEAFLPPDALPISFTPLVVETGGETVLIDTGHGDRGPATAGKLEANLAAAGLAPDAITRVLISHFHGDHINGLLTEGDQPRFPNATVAVPCPEWAFWTDAAERARASEDRRPNFDNVARVFAPLRDRLTPFDWGDTVAPGITARDASGHTPGMTRFEIASGAARFHYIADVVNHPAFFVRNPTWAAVFDMDPDKAAETRRHVLDMLADTGAPCAGFHLPFPAIGHMAREGARFRFVPTQWMAAI